MPRFYPRFCKGVLLILLCLFAPLLHAADDIAGKTVIADILARGEIATANYDPTNALPTADEFSTLYFQRFETLELDLGVKDSGLKNELEILFGALNGDAMRGVPKSRLEADWLLLRAKLVEAERYYGEGAEVEAGGAGSAFFKALLILLREGVEAMLVVGALAAWLRRAGAADRVWVIHAGVAAAIPLSLLTGWAVNRLLATSNAPLALVEGVTLLAASAMLIGVSGWMFARRSAKRWEEWIARQMESALSTGSLLALSGTACLAVYREGAETVLFYQALAIASPGQQSALYAGLACAALLLVALYFVVKKAALTLPFGLFFGATSLLLYSLAVVFVGQAIVELQAAGKIASIYLPGWPQVSTLGIAPTVQSLGAQAILVFVPLTWFVVARYRMPGMKEKRLPG
ncbi:MAG: FTR1 family protein [Zoogloeaceae bacterium]|jgi:high-affinity iron transporter|nr:FTR1 family protein [Zoogloeaceae bacterium]